MKLIGKAIALGFAVATASVVACSTGPHQSQQTGSNQNLPPEDGVGTVGLQYTLPGGEHISTISYTLTNGTNTYTGTVDVSSSSTISFVVGGVASGSNYNITLTASSDDGSVSCSGSAGPFSVAARQTTAVNVNLLCTRNTDAGSVLVNGATSNCPQWNTIVANPSAQTLGNSVTLSGAASAPDPGSLTFTWTAANSANTDVTAATISGNTSKLTADDAGRTDSATFTCPQTADTYTITLVVSDGPVPDGGACKTSDTTTTIKVTCGSPPCQNPTVGTGVAASPDTATGACPAGSVNSGTLKDSAGNFCCSLPPCQGVGTGVEATPDTAAGTCPAGQTNSLKDSQGNFCCASIQPCTTAGQTGCVSCGGSAGGTCTATEAAFVAHDIATGKATTAGPDPATSCYAQLVHFGCIDDTTGDVGNECGDLTTNAAAGPAAGTPRSTLCMNTINCIIGHSCTTSAPASPASPSNVACFCGTNTGAACTTSPSAPIGSCASTEQAGLESTDPNTDLGAYTNVTLGSGMANNIFACAIANKVAACLQ